MGNFNDIIKRAIKRSHCMNDKRIMITALNILDLKDIITEEELKYLNEIFMALKKDYTLSVTSDRDTLEQVVVISKQIVPIVENKHDVATLYNYLSKETTNKLENVVLNFFDACAHIEEDEVMIINQIIDMLENSWALKNIEKQDIDGKIVGILKFKPKYQKVKTLVK